MLITKICAEVIYSHGKLHATNGNVWTLQVDAIRDMQQIENKGSNSSITAYIFSFYINRP